VRHHEERVQAEIARHVTQVAELIVRSTRFAMLQDERELVEKIIEDVGRQPGIERVRVIDKDGTIIHTKQRRETGFSVEQTDPSCAGCHRPGQTLQHVADDDRWRILQGADGQRLLAAMEPIRNEASCSEASCHEHPASQSVLGVVDIAYRLDAVDASMRRDTFYVYLVSGGLLLAVALVAGLLLQRLVYRPLQALDAGAQRIAGGDLAHRIPLDKTSAARQDEFGRAAGSFNRMGEQLEASMHELQALVQTLEQKVDERGAALAEARAEVAQGEKLAAIGLLASGIAHELNNPLTGVLTFTSLMRQKVAEGSEDAEDLDLVIRETKRCASIIRRLLDFAREKVPSQGPVDVNTLLADVVRLVQGPATLDHVVFEADFEPGLPQPWADADLIRQVALNLVVNATQAMKRRGVVKVATRSLPADEAGSPARIEFSVSDQGTGIAPEHLAHLFEPFFTTKEVGKGTGLGLSVSWGIVKAHGGTIRVQSVAGEGSCFRVELPVQPPIEEAALATTGAAPNTKATA
jgi:two-component system NtrC family sensor kinase